MAEIKDANQVWQIAEELIGVFTTICDKCGKQDKTESASNDEVAEGLYNSGWRKKRGKLLCRECSKRW